MTGKLQQHRWVHFGALATLIHALNESLLLLFSFSVHSFFHIFYFPSPASLRAFFELCAASPSKDDLMPQSYQIASRSQLKPSHTRAPHLPLVSWPTAVVFEATASAGSSTAASGKGRLTATTPAAAGGSFSPAP
jgi:hypothetical protein